MGAAAALLVGSQVLGGLSGRAQAEGQANLQTQQAFRESQIGRINAGEFKKNASAAAASSRAANPNQDEDVEAQFAAESEVQRLRILNNAETRSLRLHQGAEQTRDQGRMAMVTGVLKAGSSLLSSSGGMRGGNGTSTSSGPAMDAYRRQTGR